MFKTLNKDMVGIAYIISSCLFFSFFNCTQKLLGHSISSYNIVFFRSIFSLITLIPFLWGLNLNLRKEMVSFSGYNIIRVIFSFGGSYCFAAGLKYMPLNEAVSLTFLTPVLTSFLAIAFFKDKPSGEKWIAIFIGLVGTLIVLNPNAESFNYAAIYVIGACAIWALSSIVMKILCENMQPIMMTFYVSFLTIIVALPYYLYNIYIPNGKELMVMLEMGVFYNLAHITMIRAYKATKLSVVAPFDFMRLVFSTLLGYIFFNEVIASRTIIGAILIIYASAIVANKARVLKK